MISLPPQVYSAIVVGTSAHSLAEGMKNFVLRSLLNRILFGLLERTLCPIGPRSFTFPASVMQPFKAQLDGQSSTNSKHFFMLDFELFIEFCFSF